MSRNLLPAITRTKSYQPVNWTARHRNCVHLEMAGYKNHEIAEILKWKAQKVSITLNDDRAELDRIEMAGMVAEKMVDVHVSLNLLSHEALKEAAEIMRYSENDGVKLKAAFGILDRAGYSTVHKTERVGEDGVPTEVIDRMAEVMDELSAHSKTYYTPEPQFDEQEAIDADYEIVT